MPPIKATTGTRFNSQRFTDFPTVAAAIKSKRIEATFMIVPLAMKLREQGVPVKICYLGHRDGSEIVVRKDDPAKSLRDLKGKTLAIPSPYSNQNLVLHELMHQQGMGAGRHQGPRPAAAADADRAGQRGH